MNSQFTWSTEWLQEFESPWGILEKFRYANAIDGNTILKLLGNERIERIKNISNAGKYHRNLVYLPSIDPKKAKEIIGININEYTSNLIDKVIHIIPGIKDVSNYFRTNVSYCQKCLSKGYHSIFHQISFFDHCAFHPEQRLTTMCIHCKTSMPEYLIQKGKIESYHCTCGYCFLESENIRKIFFDWRIQPTVNGKIVKLWLELSQQTTYDYHLVYPFDNYENITI